MSLGTQLLGGLMDSTYTPSINPDFYGIKDGKPVDKDGNPTTVYHQGNMLQRILSPTARAYSDQNANLAGQFATMAPLAQAQHNILRGNTSTDVQATPSDSWAYPGDVNASTSAILNPSLSPAGSVPQATARQFINNGGPQATGNAEFNEAVARQQQAANAAKEATMSGLIGNPESRPLVENQGLNLQSSQLAGEQSLLPSRQYNAGLQLGNETTGLLGQRATLPYTNQDALNRAQLGVAGSQEQLGELPYTIPGMRANAITQSYEAQNPAGIYQSPFNAHVMPGDGTITLGRPPLQASMMGQLSGVNAGPVTGPKGASLILPPKNPTIDPSVTGGMKVPTLIGSQPTINGVHDEAQQDIQDRHNKAAKAIHDSAQADRDVKIAELQAEKKKIAAAHLSTGLLPNIGHSLGLRPSDFPEGTLEHDIPTKVNSLIGNAGDYLGRKLWSGE